MRKFLALFILALMQQIASAQQKARVAAYIARYKDVAMEEMVRCAYPPVLHLPRAYMNQAAVVALYQVLQ